jgi:hypothetical protein
MRPVRQNDKTGANGAGVRRGVGVLALVLLASGCAGTGSAPIPGAGGTGAAPALRAGLRAAPALRAGLRAAPARALAAYASRLRPAQARRAAVARRRGLTGAPLTPPPPAGKPVVGRGRWEGAMPGTVRRFLRTVTAEGYAVARPENHR